MELKHLEAKLQNLEADLAMNAAIIQDIKGAVKDILAQGSDTKSGGQKAAAVVSAGGFSVNKTMAAISRLDVGFAQARPSHCDVEMDKVQGYHQCVADPEKLRSFDADPNSHSLLVCPKQFLLLVKNISYLFEANLKKPFLTILFGSSPYHVLYAG